MEQAPNMPTRTIQLRRNDLAFNAQGELVIKNAALIEAVRAQLAQAETPEVQGYALAGDALPTFAAISISITND